MLEKNPQILLDEPIAKESLIIFKFFNDFNYPLQNLLNFFSNYLKKKCQKEDLNEKTLFLIALNYENYCYLNKIQMENDFISKIIQDFLTISSTKEVDLKNLIYCYFLCKVHHRNDSSILNQQLTFFENMVFKNEKKFNFEKDFYFECLRFMVDISDLSGSEKIDDFLRIKTINNAYNHEANILYNVYQTINNEDHPFFQREVILYHFLLLIFC